MIRYILLVNLYSGLFYILYLVLLKNRPQHTWSRFYLLLTCLLPLVLPFIQPVIDIWQQTGQQQTGHGIILPELIAAAGGTLPTPEQDRVWLFIGYGGIVFLLLVRLALRLVRLHRFLSRLQFRQQGVCQIAINTGIGPASFGNKIIFPGAEIDPQILQHEQAHLRFHHYYDKIGITLLQCIFFPVLAFHLIGRELEAVHEFEADATAAVHPDLYARILLSAHLDVQQFPLLQSFFQHPLKRRIMMLQQKKTSDKNRHGILLALTAIMITGVLFFQSAGPVTARQSRNNNMDHENSYTPAEQLAENTDPAVMQQDEISQAAPENNHLPAEEPTEHVAIVTQQEEAALPDPESNGFPAEQPAESAEPDPQSNNSKTGTSERIYTSIEHLPEFPGGQNALMQFLAQNIRYPQEAKKQGIQGKVYLQFVIDKDGTVTNVIIQRDIGGGCGKEAVRVVQAMPKWKPGEQDGTPVRVYYTLPINFKLQK